jgi:hypothetical protein
MDDDPRQATRDSPESTSLKLNTVAALCNWAGLYVIEFQHDRFRGSSILDVLTMPMSGAGPATSPDIGAGLNEWISLLARGLREMRDQGLLCRNIDPDVLASALLATLIGGILIAQAKEDVAPLRSAVTMILAYIPSFQPANNGDE